MRSWISRSMETFDEHPERAMRRASIDIPLPGHLDWVNPQRFSELHRYLSVILNGGFFRPLTTLELWIVRELGESPPGLNLRNLDRIRLAQSCSGNGGAILSSFDVLSWNLNVDEVPIVTHPIPAALRTLRSTCRLLDRESLFPPEDIFVEE